MAVRLLCHFDGTNGSTSFTDDVGHLLTATGATVNTSAPKFGTGAGDFTSGASANNSVARQRCQRPTSGSGPFTLECQAYFTSTPNGGIFMTKWAPSSGQYSWWFGILASGVLTVYYTTDGNSVTVATSGSFTFTLNTWYHLAVDRDASNVIRIYVNGAVVASATVGATFFASTANVMIGNDPRLSFNMQGRLDEVRITAGVAQYGGCFLHRRLRRLFTLHRLLSPRLLRSQSSNGLRRRRSLGRRLSPRSPWSNGFLPGQSRLWNWRAILAACPISAATSRSLPRSTWQAG